MKIPECYQVMGVKTDAANAVFGTEITVPIRSDIPVAPWK